jgi:hypothetical protein
VGPRAGLHDMEKRKFLTTPGLEFLLLGRPARNHSLYRLHYPECCCRAQWIEYSYVALALLLRELCAAHTACLCFVQLPQQAEMSSLSGSHRAGSVRRVTTEIFSIQLSVLLNDRRVGFRFPAERRDFSLLCRFQTGSGVHPASCPVGNGLFPGRRDTDHSLRGVEHPRANNVHEVMQ